MLQVVQCRRVLKWTYATAYYAFADSLESSKEEKERLGQQQEFFEFNQVCACVWVCVRGFCSLRLDRARATQAGGGCSCTHPPLLPLTGLLLGACCRDRQNTTLRSCITRCGRCSEPPAGLAGRERCRCGSMRLEGRLLSHLLCPRGIGDPVFCLRLSLADSTSLKSTPRWRRSWASSSQLPSRPATTRAPAPAARPPPTTCRSSSSSGPCSGTPRSRTHAAALPSVAAVLPRP